MAMGGHGGFQGYPHFFDLGKNRFGLATVTNTREAGFSANQKSAILLKCRYWDFVDFKHEISLFSRSEREPLIDP